MDDPDLSLRDALADFRYRNGIDPAATSAATWTCRLGPVTVRLPNFGWRRQAILRHDLHHVLTGYPCTMRGEFQMATWEFAAGRFPHPAATVFCLPLVAAGIVWSPSAIWRAFIAGRRGRSLYGRGATQDLLQRPVRALRPVAGTHAPKAGWADAAVFVLLVLKAIAVTLAPIGLLVAAVGAMGL